MRGRGFESHLFHCQRRKYNGPRITGSRPLTFLRGTLGTVAQRQSAKPILVLDLITWRSSVSRAADCNIYMLLAVIRLSLVQLQALGPCKTSDLHF